MVKNRKRLERFERDLQRRQKVDPKRNFRIMEGLYREAVTLGVFPLKNPLEGIEVDLKIAKVVNHVPKAS